MTARADWLAWRRKGLGGSDIGAIFGVSKWGGPWSVWLDKTQGLDDYSDDRSKATGRRLERVVAEYAAERTGGDLEMAPAFDADGSSLFYCVGAEPWMRASADGALMLAADIGEYWSGLECKTAEYPSSDEWGEDGSDRIPLVYELQVRWYMAVYGAPDWHVSVFFKRADDWRVYLLKRDPRQEAEMIARARAWWTRHVVDGEPPELDASDAARRGLAMLYPQPATDSLAVATPDEEQRIRDYQNTREAAADLDRRAAMLGNQIREDIGERRGLRFTGGRAKWSRARSNRLTVNIHD